MGREVGTSQGSWLHLSKQNHLKHFQQGSPSSSRPSFLLQQLCWSLQAEPPCAYRRRMPSPQGSRKRSLLKSQLSPSFWFFTRNSIEVPRHVSQLRMCWHWYVPTRALVWRHLCFLRKSCFWEGSLRWCDPALFREPSGWHFLPCAGPAPVLPSLTSASTHGPCSRLWPEGALHVCEMPQVILLPCQNMQQDIRWCAACSTWIGAFI